MAPNLVNANNNRLTKMLSYNCKSVTRSVECIRDLCKSADFLALQETWLFQHDLPYLGTIDDDFGFFGKSSMDTSTGIFRGRPFGGVAILWRKTVFTCVTVLPCSSDRIAAIKVCYLGKSFIVFSIYMPYECTEKDKKTEHLIEFTNCLSEIIAIIENSDVDSVFVLGDFNAHPGELFCNELLAFSNENNLTCADLELLPPDTYSYISDAHGTCRWLDHCLVSQAARLSITNVRVLNDVFWSDHLPLEIECDLMVLKLKEQFASMKVNKVLWNQKDDEQINKYAEFCNNRLKEIDFPLEFSDCCDKKCDSLEHRSSIDKLYNKIVCILCEAAVFSNVSKKHKKRIVGWNLHVRQAHCEARLGFWMWQDRGKPRSGPDFDYMNQTRKLFKTKLKWCQDNQNQIKCDILASQHKAKNFKKFWSETKKLSPKQGQSVSVDGETDPYKIANLFKCNFQVQSPLDVAQVLNAEKQFVDLEVQISAKDVATAIKNMSRGKSPGHDGLSIEHLQHAGVHIHRLLSMLFTLCLGHSYLPEPLMRTVVVPIIKNKTGDVSDSGNYRPISLATVIAKVLDSVIDKLLAQKIHLHDAQFGFRPNLSTESAILSLKHTVQYYTDRSTPVYACFLDLSKAFDLVSYDLLWSKLGGVPEEVVSLLRHWYSNQDNNVKWCDSVSETYRLECGVRQGGLSSPRLFNLYVNQLIEQLSSANVGCHIDGVCVNNISYADDMVLLAPSVGALRSLLSICQSYAVAHGLRYNVTKSELMVFKSKNRTYANVPAVHLYGNPLKRVSKFKYLGHWVTDDLKDELDIERERRALSVRCNMLARRFARCTPEVKISLFKAYCQTFYTCSLWVRYTQKTYSALRVQYNNAFRVLMGLPRFCSASKMFADARTNDFFAIMRNRSSSLLARILGSSNSILGIVADRWDSPLLQHWTRLHMAGAAGLGAPN